MSYEKQTERTFADTERDVLCGHFGLLAEGETLFSAFVLLPQVAHNHSWFLTAKRYKISLCSWQNVFSPHLCDIYLLTGLTGEGLLYSGLLHLNILVLVQPFFWDSLQFGL